ALDRVERLAAHPHLLREPVLGPAAQEASVTQRARRLVRHPEQPRSRTAPMSSRPDSKVPDTFDALNGPRLPPVEQMLHSRRAMLTERDVIMRLVRQLAELLAAALRLRREGKRDEALRQIDAITGRLTGMDAGALCMFGEAPLAGLPRELKVPLACVL